MELQKRLDFVFTYAARLIFLIASVERKCHLNLIFKRSIIPTRLIFNLFYCVFKLKKKKKHLKYFYGQIRLFSYIAASTFLRTFNSFFIENSSWRYTFKFNVCTKMTVIHVYKKKKKRIII